MSALASGRGLPVHDLCGVRSSDRHRDVRPRLRPGSGGRKLGRAIWVVSCWILTPIIAIVATGLIAQLIHHFSTAGLFLGLALSISVRLLFKHRADEHEKNYEPAEDDPHLSTL
ncbi:MAG: hypothetical protein R3B91_16280 [Planctomycetaceae bacterium]